MSEKKDLVFNQLVTPESVLFFDMDGTLIDTDYANFLSYKKAIGEVFQNDFDLSYNPKQRFNRTFLKEIIPNLTEKELNMIIYNKEKCFKDYLSETSLNYEIVEILINYFTLNKTVLVTNCRKERALETLLYHELIDKFSNLFFRKFDKGNKINKFQNAIIELAISPQLIIVFENEESEISDAITAGIQYINPIIQKNE